jgi:hypothetical protein
VIQWASLQAAALAGLSLISGPPVILGEKAGDISQASNQALRIESVFCSKTIHEPSFFWPAGINSRGIVRYSGNFQSKLAPYVLAYTLLFEQVYPSFQFAGEALKTP